MPVPTIDAAQAHLTSCRLERRFRVWVELADRDDARVRQAVTEAVGLEYGAFTDVAFESGQGTQFFQAAEGSTLGAGTPAMAMPARVLTFTVPADPELLATAIEAVRHSHSYEEPVIVVQDAWITRADYTQDRDNPNRWWNRGFDV